MHPEGCDRALQHAVCQFTVRPIAQMIRASIAQRDKIWNQTGATALFHLQRGFPRCSFSSSNASHLGVPSHPASFLPFL